MGEVARYPSDHVSSDCRAHGANFFVDERCIVAVDDQGGHDPEDEHALEEIIVVE